MSIQKINIAEKLALFDDYFNPRRIATVDDFEVKVAKIKGEFVWHHHEDIDELFWVITGTLKIELRDGEIVLNPGEIVVIPAGVEHRPVAEEEVHLVLIEKQGTVNTGTAAASDLTRETIEEI